MLKNDSKNTKPKNRRTAFAVRCMRLLCVPLVFMARLLTDELKTQESVDELFAECSILWIMSPLLGIWFICAIISFFHYVGLW